MRLENKIENIFDQIGEGVSEGFLKIHALSSYLSPEIRRDFSREQTNLRKMVSYATEGTMIGAYFLNSTQDKRWLLVPIVTNVISFCCSSYFSSHRRKNLTKQVN